VTDPTVPRDDRADLRAKLLLSGFFVVVVLAVGYPLAFFGWYLTAEQVTVQITSCGTDVPNALRCPIRGTWQMADGSTGSGRIYSIETISDNGVGRKLSAHATRSWAVADGVTASAPGLYAVIAAAADLVLAVMVIVLRGLNPRPRR
jgi:hypothetical protein